MNENNRITEIKHEELKFEFNKKHGETRVNICNVNSVQGEFSKTIYRAGSKSLEEFLDRVNMQRVKLRYCTFFCEGEFYHADYRIVDGNTFADKKNINAASDAYKFIWSYKIIE